MINPKFYVETTVSLLTRSSLQLEGHILKCRQSARMVQTYLEANSEEESKYVK